MAIKLKVVSLGKNPADYLGEAIKVFLKDRAKDGQGFYFKVTGCGPDYIDGYDDERLNLRIDVEDIDFIIAQEV